MNSLFFCLHLIFLFSIISSTFLPKENLSEFTNDRPIIGILSMSSNFPDKYSPEYYSFFGAAYVKFLESSGARVVPILYDYDKETLWKLFKSINGILLPGGDTSLWVNETSMTGFSQLTLTAIQLFEWAIEANKQGDYFPIWGTCLGFEIMMMSLSKNDKVLGHFNSGNHHSNLTFINDKSKVFKNLDINVKKYAEENKPAYLWHQYGKSYESFLEDEYLNNNFMINTVTKDKDGKLFVSSIEHKYFPFYGTQFHPEVNIFMFGKTINADHSQYAVELSQYLSNFIVSESRLNRHQFNSDEEENKYLIYNFSPVTYLDDFYEQSYIFSKPLKN